MSDLSKLTEIIEAFDADRSKITETITDLETKEKTLNSQKTALLETISNNEKTLKRQVELLKGLDETITEVKAGYNKIMESTKMLLDIVSSKQTNPI